MVVGWINHDQGVTTRLSVASKNASIGVNR